MNSATAPPLDGHTDAGPPPAEHVATAMREALLEAIGELSEEERERLMAADAPDETARVWSDLVAERAAREREASVRAEMAREHQTQVRAARTRPTSGLQGSAPPPLPRSVAEWTDFIREGDDQALRQRRRSQFAQWLAANPDA